MPIIYFLLSFFTLPKSATTTAPLKIAILYYTPVDQKLKAELCPVLVLGNYQYKFIAAPLESPPSGVFTDGEPPG
jgi:hypothetical protein